MSSKERFPIEDGLFHVTNRGVDRRDIALDDDDRREWLKLLGRNAVRCGWRVFAFALLGNHFHLYLRVPRANLSTGMRDFEGAYASHFNERQQREGHLFQSRFHAVIVENDQHSWELSRYVHLNSFRAGLVRDPIQDSWNSYRHYLNPFHAPKWLDWRTVLAEFGGSESQARLAYKRFVDAGMVQPPANPLSAAVDDWILGGDEFVAKCRAWREKVDAGRPLVGLHEVIDAVAVTFQTGPEQVCKRGQHSNRVRDAAILLSRELVDEPLDVLAKEFGGVSRSAITETARRARERAEREPEFAAVFETIRRRLGR